MTTWISRGRALLGVIVLSGCVQGAADFLPGRTVPRSIEVAAGRVVIAGPSGYCIDRGASRPGAETAFVVLGSCAALSGRSSDPHPDSPSLLTATVAPGPRSGAEIAGALDTLESFFGTEAGRAALARDGRADSISVLRTERGEAAFYLYLADRSESALPGTQGRYWRGIFDLNGRLITLSVIPVEGRPISEASAFAILLDFEAAVRTATAAGPDAPRPPGEGPLALFGGLLR